MARLIDVPDALGILADAQEGLFATSQAVACGLAGSTLRDGQGPWTKVAPSVWTFGSWCAPTTSERSRRLALARRRAFTIQLRHRSAVASDDLAAELWELDGWWTGDATTHDVRRRGRVRPGWRSRELDDADIVVRNGVRVTSALRTLLDLAERLSADDLELAVECALHRRLVRLAQLTDAAIGGGRKLQRLREVLGRRPAGTVPTESMLETLGVQLARLVPGLREPDRQVRVLRSDGTFVARVDLAWPDLGIFYELDGEDHEGQPRYDATRQTLVVATKGWLPIRMTWTSVVHNPLDSVRRIMEVRAQAEALRPPLA